MVGVRNQTAHVGGSRRAVFNCVTSKWIGATVKKPSFLGRSHTRILGRNRIEEEVDVGTGESRRVSKRRVVNNVVLTVQANGVYQHRESSACGRCRR